MILIKQKAKPTKGVTTEWPYQNVMVRKPTWRRLKEISAATGLTMVDLMDKLVAEVKVEGESNGHGGRRRGV